MTTTTIAPPARLAATFRELADRWQAETLYLSSTTEIAMHFDYQRIIGLGAQVLPLILVELAARPGHWFWALAALTGEDPVPAADRGDRQAMADAWLRWGRGNGWIA